MIKFNIIVAGLFLLVSCSKPAAQESTNSSTSTEQHEEHSAHDEHGMSEDNAKPGKDATPELFASLTVKEDPICGMSFAEYPISDTLRTAEGKLYGFCSAHCKEEFEKHKK
ncbi:MAG: hypothetical protein LC115_00445 [Bacteroidia bacterium]|nr:hypothetical protein [Bacteroidia bacterium]